jgi:O-antigen/teichoic acid export membrane protein
MSDESAGSIADQIRAFLKESSIYGVGMAVSKMTSFVMLPLVTAMLTPADMGILTLLQVFTSVVSIFLNAGVQQAINRNYYDDATAEHRAAVVGTGLVWRLIVTVIIIGGFALVAKPASRLVLSGSDPIYVIYFLFVLANVAIMSPQGIAYTLYRVRRQPIRSVVFNVSGAILSMGTMVWLLWIWPRGIRGALEAAVIANAIIVVVMLPDLLRSAKLRLRKDVLQGILSYGLPFLPHHLAIFLLFGADRYFIEHYCGLTEVGLYSYAYRVGMIMTLVLEGASMAWTPFLFSTHKREDARTIHGLSARYVIAAIITTAVAVITFGNELIKLLAIRSPEYWSALYLVPWIVVGYIFLGLYQVFGASVGIPKRTKLLPLFSISGLVVNLVLNWYLVPRWGTLGAAVATAIAYGAMALVTVIVSQRVYHVEFEWGRLSILGAAGAVVATIGWMLPTSPLVPIIALKLVLVASFPILLLAVGFFSLAERERIYGAIRYLTGKNTD